MCLLAVLHQRCTWLSTWESCIMDAQCYFCFMSLSNRPYHTHTHTPHPPPQFPVILLIAAGVPLSEHGSPWERSPPLCHTSAPPAWLHSKRNHSLHAKDSPFIFSEHLHSIVYFYLNNCVFFFLFTLLTHLLSLSLQEMIIDKVNGQPVPRYLIYDIIKFNVSSPAFWDCVVSPLTCHSWQLSRSRCQTE